MADVDLRQLEKDLLKTSFPLEMKCTDALLKRGWDVRNNFIFEDPEQLKHREIDVFACDAPSIFHDKRCMTFYLFIECKKSRYPWIFFPSSGEPEKVILGLDNLIWVDRENKRSDEESSKLISDLRWNSRFHQSQIFSWFFEKEEEKGKKEKEHAVHDALSKLAKVSHYISVGERDEGEPLTPPLVYVINQAIVLDGLMCKASARGNRISLKPMNHLVLGTVFMCPTFHSHMLVDVVQANYFPRFIKILETEKDSYVRLANNFYRSQKEWTKLLEK